MSVRWGDSQSTVVPRFVLNPVKQHLFFADKVALHFSFMELVWGKIQRKDECISTFFPPPPPPITSWALFGWGATTWPSKLPEGPDARRRRLSQRSLRRQRCRLRPASLRASWFPLGRWQSAVASMPGWLRCGCKLSISGSTFVGYFMILYIYIYTWRTKTLRIVRVNARTLRY